MRKGFTLVELSIVLVIIGLLIGGILVGQSLINSSKINAQVRQLQQFDIATNTFKTKFKQTPGDCATCTKFWDFGFSGNGLLEADFATCPTSTLYSENSLFFTQLYEMGVIKDQYRIGGGLTYLYGKGYNYPAATIGHGGLFVQGNQKKELFYMFLFDSGSNSANFPVRFAQGNFSPEEALAIDAKVDDGFPNTGSTVVTTASVNNTNGGAPYPMVLDNVAASCTTAGTGYNVSNSGANLCRLMVKAQVY